MRGLSCGRFGIGLHYDVGHDDIGSILSQPQRDPLILLTGADKKGDDRFYDRYVPVADDLYDVYIEELRKEGLL